MTKFSPAFSPPSAAAAPARRPAAAAPSSASRDQIRAVGSSTVYPFAKAVADSLAKSNTDVQVADHRIDRHRRRHEAVLRRRRRQHPDIENASRRMKKSEYRGLREERRQRDHRDPGRPRRHRLRRGQGRRPASTLTPADVYKALAANPFGKPQHRQDLEDVNPSLPGHADPGLRPALDLGHARRAQGADPDKGCESDPAMKALKDSDKDQHEEICTEVRERRRLCRPGENDNLIVQKIEANPEADRHLRLLLSSRRTPTRCRASRMNGVDADLRDHRRLQLSRRPAALHLRQGRAPRRDQGPQGIRRRMGRSRGAATDCSPRQGMVVSPDDVQAQERQRPRAELTAARPRRPRSKPRTAPPDVASHSCFCWPSGWA